MVTWNVLIDEDGCFVASVDDYVDPEILENECLETKPFQPMLKFKGIEVPQPRLISWLADDPALTYAYSGIFLEPKPMPPAIQKLSKRLESDLSTRFPTCLLNIYRNGRDSVSWHSDNEKELGANSTIATVSLGAIRTFELKHRHMKPNRIVRIGLRPASLLVMIGRTQSVWLHQIPKEPAVIDQRISLTFRPHVKMGVK